MFGLLAMGRGRRQVFNEYFHSSPAVWRDYAVEGGVARSLGRGFTRRSVGGKGRRVGLRKGLGKREV